MSGYLEALLVLLAINVVVAYGGYTSAYATDVFGAPLIVGILMGATAAAIVAWITAVPVLRTHGIYLALATFALGQVIQASFLNFEALGGASGYPVAAYASPEFVWTVAAVVVAVFFLSRTRFSLYVTAAKKDPIVTDLFGVNVRAIEIAAFAIGAFIAGIAGALYGHHLSYLEPQYFGILLSVYVALYVILGGTQTFYGPILGAVFFTVLPKLLRGSEEWRFIIFAGFIIVFMALRPEGFVTTALVLKASLSTKRG